MKICNCPKCDGSCFDWSRLNMDNTPNPFPEIQEMITNLQNRILSGEYPIEQFHKDMRIQRKKLGISPMCVNGKWDYDYGD